MASTVVENDETLKRCAKQLKEARKVDEGDLRKLVNKGDPKDLQWLQSVLNSQLRSHVSIPKKKDLLGPGRYTPRNLRDKSPLTPRMVAPLNSHTEDLKDKFNTPGAGSYAFPSALSKISAPITGRKKESVLDVPVFHVPGPGAYESSKEPVGSRPADLQVTMKSSKDYNVHHKLKESSQKPGPGLYKIEYTRRGQEQIGMLHRPDPQFQPQKSVNVEEIVPGPGSHQVERWPSKYVNYSPIRDRSTSKN